MLFCVTWPETKLDIKSSDITVVTLNDSGPEMDTYR